LTDHRDPEALIGLGEACADAGRYKDAVAAGERAFALVQATNPVMGAQIRRRLEQWRALAK